MSRIRIEGLLAAFPKLVGSGGMVVGAGPDLQERKQLQPCAESRWKPAGCPPQAAG